MPSTADALRKLAEALSIVSGEKAGEGEPGDKPTEGKEADGDGEWDEDDSEDHDEGDEGDGDDSYFDSGGETGDLPSPEWKDLPEDILKSIPKEKQPTPKPGLALPIDDWEGYRIHPPAKAGDRVERIEDKASPGDLSRYRHEMDKHLPDAAIVSRLATKLARFIMAQQTRAWSFDEEEGLLDPARLARVVTEPSMPLAYKKEHEGKFKETTLTILVDNSGSMGGGNKTVIAAMCTDILTRVFERCGIKVEVLGWTTHGTTSVPREKGGRFCFLRHLIYKDASVPYRRVRNNFGWMWSGRGFSQNVDGEALIWAYNRLVCRPEPRKILMVISDGEPAAEYWHESGSCSRDPLTSHLRQVIAQIEERGVVELVAIGAEHDVRPFYKNSIYVPDVERLGAVLMDKLISMFKPGGT